MSRVLVKKKIHDYHRETKFEVHFYKRDIVNQLTIIFYKYKLKKYSIILI